MNNMLVAKKGRGAVTPRTLVATLGALVVIAVAVYFLWPEAAVEPIPSPVQVPDTVSEPPPLQHVEPAKTKEERGDTAREVIAQLKAADGATNYAQAYVRAQEFEAGELFADAHLLYFFAARGGYGPAAFDLAKIYDPNHHQPENGLMNEPDALQAYRWYKQALAAGVDAAGGNLAALHTWAEQAARGGDTEAERLLLQWE